MMLRYSAKRRVDALDSHGRKVKVALVQIELPDGGITSLVIEEAEMTALCHGNKALEQATIQSRCAHVVSQMTAGTASDLIITSH
jgi:hypothetical protein